jgi:4-hydroxy-tetrahydrodipicolinate synthase
MTLDKNKLNGIFPAMVTPTNSDGKINEEQTSKLIKFLIESGVTGLVPLGGTGEFTNLEPSERVKFVEIVVNETNGMVPVIAGVLSPGFGEAINTGMDFKKAGVDGIMLLTPFYVTPTQEGIRSYFNDFVSKISLPTLIYDIPYRTGVSIEPETVRRLADENELVIGMKACNTNLAYFTRLMAIVEDSMSVLSGEEYLFLSHMVLGAKGGVLATCNLFPLAWIKMYDLLTEGEVGKATKILFRLIPLLDAAFAEINPGPLKAAMGMRGFKVGSAIKPLIEPSENTVAALKSAIQDLTHDPI